MFFKQPPKHSPSNREDLDNIIHFFREGSPRSTKYKDTNATLNFNLLTSEEIKSLLTEFPDEFEQAEKSDPNFVIKRDCANAIQQDTLNYLKEISEQLASGNTAVSKSIEMLYELLTKKIHDFPENEQQNRIKEREAITSLTEFDFVSGKGLTPYGFERRATLIGDLISIKTQEGKCPDGFCKQITNLYSLVQLIRNYDEAKEDLTKKVSLGVK